MKNKFLKYLVDPLTGENISQKLVFKQIDNEIIDGLLFFSSWWYPIINGVPRLLVNGAKSDLLRRYFNFFETYRLKLPTPVSKQWKQVLLSVADSDKFSIHQRKTAESFTFEWKNIYRENSFEQKNYLHFTGPFVDEKLISNKTIIDVGCGSGRFTKQPALIGAKVVFGVDLGDTVEVAYQLTRNLTNVAIVQCDIYNLPFGRVFDLAHSIGVIHHLSDPYMGFSKLPKLLKKEGQLIVWVYNRRHNNRALYFYEPVRKITSRLPKELLYYICYIPAFGVHMINLLTEHFKNPPFGYYRNFPFNMKLNDTFDVFATPKCNYFLVEEVIGWYKRVGLKKIKAYEHPEAGITCIGTHG